MANRPMRRANLLAKDSVSRRPPAPAARQGTKYRRQRCAGCVAHPYRFDDGEGEWD